MNGLDIVLLVLAAGLALLGLLKGLTRILIGVAALVCAVLVAGLYHPVLSRRLGWLDWPEEVLALVAFGAIFLGVMLAGAVAAWFARRVVKAAMLSWADRLAGGALGLVGAAVLAGLLLLPLVAYAPAGGRLLERSVLAPWVVLVADVAGALVPPSLSERYRQRVDALRHRWRSREAGRRTSV